MKTIKAAMPDNIIGFIESNKIEFVKRVDCTVCNGLKTLITIKVNGETRTRCDDCENKKLAKELNLPTSEEYKHKRDSGFILNFERITNDLTDATVRSYKVDGAYPSQEKAKQAAFDFITEYTGKESLVLAGVPGIGKSHLSYAINKAIRSKGYKTLFIKSTDLLDAIKETYGHHSNITQEQIFKMINDLDLLVLDDLGGEYEKKDGNTNETWASDVLYKVLDMRLGKSLITTTNYNETGIVDKYGQVQGNRILSRMMENATAIRVEGKDLRRKERF